MRIVSNIVSVRAVLLALARAATDRSFRIARSTSFRRFIRAPPTWHAAVQHPVGSACGGPAAGRGKPLHPPPPPQTFKAVGGVLLAAVAAEVVARAPSCRFPHPPPFRPVRPAALGGAPHTRSPLRDSVLGRRRHCRGPPAGGGVPPPPPGSPPAHLPPPPPSSPPNGPRAAAVPRLPP